MCGIVGYIGNKQTLPIIIEGIKRLEYRGYDSSGLAVINADNALIIHKKEGKIVELEQSIPKGVNFDSHVGIAHTRWATHGEPTTVNAHPHTDCTGTIAVVHNGIIENYQILRDKLEEEGHECISDTDTEVIAHLIEQFYRRSGDMHTAVRMMMSQVKGTLGIVVINREHPGKLWAARRGSPLIIGVGEEQNFIASDVAALVVHTKHVIYLQDDETAEISADDFTIKTVADDEVQREINEIDWDISMIDKGEYEFFMLKEIFEQPTTIANAFRGRIMDVYNTARLGGISLTIDELNAIQNICIVACGTSWHAGLVGQYLIEDIAKIPVRVEYASEFRYRDPILSSDTLVIVISQSGETADTLAALREARARGVKVMGITNVVGSTIARETDFGSYIHAGAEIGVASTKAFTSQITVLSLLALLLGRMRVVSPQDGAKFLKEMKRIPEKVLSILDMNDEIRDIAGHYKDSDNALYLGRGINYPVALEGALKLKEISYIHAEGYPAAEMKHGPIALIDENMPVIVIAPDDFVYKKIVSNIEEVKARKGKIIVVANKDTDGIEHLADHIIYIPRTLPALTPLLTVIPLQLFAYHVAVLRGLNVDQPRNLAKSVTVE
ncbi:MAG TPA: glutamine--fructose-6-phosphate transaminase (isomerizing) [Candidatus Cloacimonetes bacterium]|nr:glutamine--fructose-6-phosphate transaminase (isomerizing) [Candidatus Cloacimonadota bacterium]